jgi:hypothetical protein
LLRLASVIVLFSCAPTGTLVTVPTYDPTPPTVELDVYGLPALTPQPTPTGTPGSPPAPPPLVLTTACCDTTRSIDPGTTLSLIAGGSDQDGGVSVVAIVASWTVTCGLQQGGTSIVQDTGTQDYSRTAKAGDLVPPSALAQANITVQELARNTCGTNPLVGECWSAYAHATNFSNLDVRTKTFTFAYPATGCPLQTP